MPHHLNPYSGCSRNVHLLRDEGVLQTQRSLCRHSDDLRYPTFPPNTGVIDARRGRIQRVAVRTTSQRHTTGRVRFGRCFLDLHHCLGLTGGVWQARLQVHVDLVRILSCLRRRLKLLTISALTALAYFSEVSCFTE